MEQGNCRQQISLCSHCGITGLTTYFLQYFLNLSPVNAKLTSLSYIQCSSANCHTTADRYKCAKNGLAKVTVDVSKSSIKLRHMMRWWKSV